MTRLVLLFLLSIVSTTSFAQFEGTVVLEPLGCQSIGECVLKQKLRYVSKSGIVWEAAAGIHTDGASIPAFFQPFIGGAFDDSFLKASIIHDHYCRRHVRSWRATHRFFYEGLIAGGVPEAKAKVMYYAVYLGGPKWVELVPGNKCGKNCINNVKLKSGKPRTNFREADYSLFKMDDELKQLFNELEKKPNSISIEELERRAESKRPGDYYYRNGDRIVINDPGIVE